MFRTQLKRKVGLYLFIALSPAMVLLPYYIVDHQHSHSENELARHVTQVAELIVKSTHHAMLLNQRDITEKIIGDIARQPGIQHVRVLNKNGTVIHSSRPEETGTSVDQRDEPCIHCHQTAKPAERLPDENRWRIYKTADGQSVLGAMEVIRNEPSCTNASCHEHRADQSLLGVVDIAYSMDAIDRALRQHGLTIALISAGAILLASLIVGVLLQKLIYLPLRDLESGARRVSDGDLEHSIPVRSVDEFGRLAGSFNRMTAALKASVNELESQVEKRTHELKLAEAEVARGEKLASVGQLAAGIAHELNNPLTGVLTFTSLLRKKAPDGSPEAEDLDLVIRETRRCASIIRRLLDFAREKVPSKGLFDLNRLIEETVEFVDRSATLARIVISTDLDPTLPKVWGEADLIKQVVLNILVNATQAITDSGSIAVRTRVLAAVSASKPETESEPMVEVCIRDTGCGIPAAHLQRIFDPFFTTKEVGKGTGLGLSVSWGIVKAHGGMIKVESEVGVGTTFRVLLPVKSAVEEASTHTADSTP